MVNRKTLTMIMIAPYYFYKLFNHLISSIHDKFFECERNLWFSFKDQVKSKNLLFLIVQYIFELRKNRLGIFFM
jgi:hypothetical protein